MFLMRVNLLRGRSLRVALACIKAARRALPACQDGFQNHDRVNLNLYNNEKWDSNSPFHFRNGHTKVIISPHIRDL